MHSVQIFYENWDFNVMTILTDKMIEELKKDPFIYLRIID